MNKKQEYEEPSLMLIKFTASDVISTSNAYIEEDDTAWV